MLASNSRIASNSKAEPVTNIISSSGNMPRENRNNGVWMVRMMEYRVVGVEQGEYVRGDRQMVATHGRCLQGSWTAHFAFRRTLTFDQWFLVAHCGELLPDLASMVEEGVSPPQGERCEERQHKIVAIF